MLMQSEGTQSADDLLQVGETVLYLIQQTQTEIIYILALNQQIL